MSPVLFTQGCCDIIGRACKPVYVLIDVGPSDSTAGAIGQIKQ
jgi:hypothetical protein